MLLEWWRCLGPWLKGFRLFEGNGFRSNCLPSVVKQGAAVVIKKTGAGDLQAGATQSEVGPLGGVRGHPVRDYLTERQLLALAAVFGGTEIIVPKAPSRLLMDKVGKGMAYLLCRAFGGDRVYIPKMAAECLHRRNLAIAKDGESMPVPLIADRYQISQRQVYSILSRHGVTAKPGVRRGPGYLKPTAEQLAELEAAAAEGAAWHKKKGVI